MPGRRTIRNKLLVGGLLVCVVVAILSASSFVGIYSYRRLVRALSSRAAELPVASQLGERVEQLRLSRARCGIDPPIDESVSGEVAILRGVLDDYLAELNAGEMEGVPIADRSHERKTAAAIASSLDRLGAAEGGVAIRDELDRLAELTADLPSFLQEQLHDLAREVRTRYRTLIITTWAAAAAAAVLLAALGSLTYRWIFRPLRHLAAGSRRVASGDFDFRVGLDTDDEMAELAEALNGMTERFCAIRDDLDRQVQLRTREVIRSEQLASVGFLAAGVAHEINNPLASIAMCAESLETRIASLYEGSEERAVSIRYLELIQAEAFRCKEITEKLLDFSRLGEVRRQPTAIKAIITDVAEMLRHVGRFAGRSIEIEEGPDLLVMVNPREIKQVVLNLLVNALDSVDPSGSVAVRLHRNGSEAVVEFRDDGCGMTTEVLEHLFEPFFTRRRSGQGTGLGLSIVHRIVTDHGGRIEASSDGPDTGATFRVSLPVAAVGGQPKAAGKKEVDHQRSAA